MHLSVSWDEKSEYEMSPTLNLHMQLPVLAEE